MAYRLSVARVSSALLCTTFLACVSAYADDTPTFGPVDGPYGIVGTYIRNISADGQVVVGTSEVSPGVRHAIRWENGIATDLGSFGGNDSFAYDVSANGDVIVGNSYLANNADYHAFRWTSGGGLQDLGTLGGTTASADFISRDGSIIAGYSSLAGNVNTHAMRWTVGSGIQDLGTLGGGNSMTTNLSNDGSTIIGYSQTTGNAETHAFRWRSGGMIDLGTLGGNNSYAYAVSANGNVVAGTAVTSLGEGHAFRWVGGVMSDLGTLGGTYSDARLISADGSVVAGYAATPGDAQALIYRSVNGGPMTSIGTLGGTTIDVRAMSDSGNTMMGISTDVTETAYYYYTWTVDAGMRSFEQVLTDAGVDFTNWSLQDIGYDTAMSADGKYVTGTALYNGVERSFIFSTTADAVGIMTPVAVSASLQSVSVAVQQAAAASTQQIGQTLFMARHINSLAVMSAPVSYGTMDTPLSYGDEDISSIAPAAGPLQARRGLALYTLGSYGVGQNNDFDNHDDSGTVGIDLRLSESFNLGVGVLGAQSKTDLPFDGTTRINARGVSSILSYEPEHFGLRLYGAAFVADLNSDRTRGYANGSGLDFSKGKTDGFAYGGAAQIGWQFPVMERSAFMPYAELQVSKTKMDAYTETGGAFPASFTDQESTSVTSYLGVEQKYDLTSHVNLLGRLAWGHRLDDGGDSFIGTAAGLTQTLGSDVGDKNWAEATVGIGWQASEKLHLNAEVSGRSGDTAAPAVDLTLGASYAF